MIRTSNSGTKLDQSWPFALADGEVSFVGEPVAIVVAERPLYRRGRRRARRGRLRRAAGGDRLPGRAMRRAVRRELASNAVIAYKVAYGDIDAAFAKAAHVVREDLWVHRGAAHSMEGRGILAQISDRETAVWASTQKAHDLRTALRRLHRSRRKPAARGDARRRRRLRAETVRLSRGRGGGRRGDLAAPLGQMDRGPPRAFHQCGAGARPILVDRDRRRCRRPRARRARPAHPRHRRLCAAGREHPVQFRDHADRPLYGAGAGDGRGRDPHQQGAGLFGARRRLSASGVRHGAADGSVWRTRSSSTAPNCAAAI